MKLFFAVLAAMLAAGFISWLVLSLAQALHHERSTNRPLGTSSAPSN